MHVFVSGQGQVEGTFDKIDVRCLYACVREGGQGQVEGTFGKIDVRCLYACVREWLGLG